MRVSIDPAKCVGCGLCIEICPTHALKYQKSKAAWTENKCNACGTCDRICICSALVFNK